MLDLGRESRIATGFEIRRLDNVDEHRVTFEGYASVFNHPYDVAGGPDLGGWTETVAPGAFKRTLGIPDNRALLYGHDSTKVLATTRSGGLTLAEDGVGLLVRAELDTRVQWIDDLVHQIEAGVVDEMSIGFYTKASDWSPDYSERTLREAALVEATVTWAGANGATVAAIERSRDAVVEARTKTARVDRVAIAARAARAALDL